MQNVVSLKEYREERAKSVEMVTPEVLDTTDGKEMSRREFNRMIAARDPKVMELARLLTVARYRYEDKSKFPNLNLASDFKPMDAFIAQAVGFHGDDGLVDYMSELLRRELDVGYLLKKSGD